MLNQPAGVIGKGALSGQRRNLPDRFALFYRQRLRLPCTSVVQITAEIACDCVPTNLSVIPEIAQTDDVCADDLKDRDAEFSDH